VDDYYDSFYAPENRYLNTLNYSLDFYGAPVPEPSTWALVGLGGAAALLLRRTRQKPSTSKCRFSHGRCHGRSVLHHSTVHRRYSSRGTVSR
jgi:hypothetical protein